jgi:hypothetical protein
LEIKEPFKRQTLKASTFEPTAFDKKLHVQQRKATTNFHLDRIGPMEHLLCDVTFRKQDD